MSVKVLELTLRKIGNPYHREEAALGGESLGRARGLEGRDVGEVRLSCGVVCQLDWLWRKRLQILEAYERSKRRRPHRERTAGSTGGCREMMRREEHASRWRRRR